MKKLIELFNKKYGATYGIIDDSIDNEDVYKVYKMIKSLCSDDQEIMEMLNKIKLPSPRTAKESIEKININVSGGLSKEYVDDKTEILPVKNTYTVFEDAVPSRVEEDMSTYNVISTGYIFESLQNEDMIIPAVKFNLNVTFNDGTNDITKDLILEGNGDGYGAYEDNDIMAFISYNKAEHLINMIIIEANEYRPYDILRATLSCEAYSNLLQNHHIQSINYYKIENVPSKLNRIVDGDTYTLMDKEYYNLYDNLFIWDANKFNERLDENSGVKQNLTIAHTIQVKQKDSEGIGFGQHIPIDSLSSLFIVANTGADVIIKVYNSTTKELIDTLDYLEYGKYKTLTLDTYELNGVSSVFLAFTVKDSVKNFYGNTYIYDLIVYNNSSFLTKGELLTKTNTKEYIPSGDYNPATKKYVDEKTASIDTTINNNLPSNGALTLTTNKFQTTTLATPTEIQLPEVTGYAEIHLFFTGVSGVTIGTGTTNVKWENQPTIEDNKTYELIFTYINDTIGWVAKTVVYS